MGDMRAPAGDGAVLAEPSLAQAGRLLTENRRRFGESSLTIFDRSLSELQENVRRDAVILAASYVGDVEYNLSENESASLIVTGHQPELFHPGVWVKNFAINGVATWHSAIPLNLIIDNDAPKSSFLRIPVRDDTNPRWRRVTFDRWRRGTAYEDIYVGDRDAFETFAERAQPIMQQWPFVSMLPDFWGRVVQNTPHSWLLGDRFAVARRAVERDWGCRNLELPIRLLCQTDGFRLFAAHLFVNIERFHAAYNNALCEYRTRHEIRSPTHPVPDLAKDGDWCETPFWGWRTNEVRQRLWLRHCGPNVELRAGRSAWPNLPVESPAELLRVWAKIESNDFKIRTRALTTTLFARLFLADLFVHGIGGALYDEIGDAILRDFYEIDPPHFIIVSATLRLPFPSFEVLQDGLRQLQRRHRDLHWNPQRHFHELSNVPEEALRLADEKQRWIDKECTTKIERRERYRQLSSLNEQIRLSVAERSLQALEEWGRCYQTQLQANDIYGRRDYAFCLYPEDKLRELCVRFLS